MGWLKRWQARAKTPAAGAIEEVLAAGKQLITDGDFAAAEQYFRKALALDAQRADTSVSLGFALLSQGRSRDAMVPLQSAVALAPADADAHYLLGAACLDAGDSASAVAPLRQAVHLQPGLVVASRDLARALFETGHAGEAEDVLRTALRAAPGFVDLHLFLGNVLAGSRRYTAAADSYRAALAIEPDNPGVLSSLAPALLASGDVKGAADAARSALALDPALLAARSNLLLALSADADCTPATYLQEARQFERYCGAEAASQGLRQPDSLLRVGFVSGDLRRHPVGYFLGPFLAHRDRSAMVLVAYNNQPGRDALTDTLRQGFDLWHDVWQLDDTALSAIIRADRIDILVDLSGHTPGNRLAVFARRAAAVQASWLGYWASTGLSNIDFFIADPVSTPCGHEHHFVESVRRLPASRLCFSGPGEAGVPLPGPLPAFRRGHVTFASFQRMAKIDDASLALWAGVLAAIPSARMRLQTAYFDDADQRAAFVSRLQRLGIDASRVDCVGEQPRAAYLAAHAEVDVVLDTVLHTGATTTCEALWMGVPTLTLCGDRLLARQGASILAAAGLAGWIATDEADLVARAIAFAGDLGSLAACREGLRASVSASALMDGPRFARDIESLLAGLAGPAAAPLSA